MHRILPIAAALAGVAVLAAAASADMVVERWGQYRFTQHKAVAFARDGEATTMTVDLAALPAGTKVYRARLVFVSGRGYEVSAGGKALSLVEPYALWFDAAGAVRTWVAAGAGQGTLSIRGTRPEPKDVYLEIAYEGKLASKPAQVAGVRAFHWHGQTFLTWRELEDLAGGKEDVTWGEMVEKVRDCNPMVGIIPKWPDREIRYSVYRHGEPITAANIGAAEFIHDAMQGSEYAEDAIARGQQGEHGPVFLKAGQVLRRVILEKNKMLPPGTGYHWVNAARPGAACYAVVASIDGVENTVDFSPANTAGPIDEVVCPPRPMLAAENVTPIRGKADAQWHERWYSFWCPPPLSAYPRRYDAVVLYCEQSLGKRPALTIVREAWNYPPDLRVRPEARPDLVLTHTLDVPIAFRMGPADFHYTLRSPEQSKWEPWTMRRQKALIDWLADEFAIDRDRVVVSMGSWGMMEIEQPEVYAMIHGYGQPEVTRGFQCWHRACGVWGDPGVYEGRPAAANPFLRSDYSTFVLADPGRETPFFKMYPIRSSHLTEMGWPALPRFWRAMIDSHHPFVYNWRVKREPEFRRDRSVPAFGNCSLDGNPGNGDLRQGETFDTAINSWLTWDAEGIVDEPGRWEMTVYLDGDPPRPACTVDVTPRKCQQFHPAAGHRFVWTNTALADNKPIQSAAVTADRWGLVTLPAVQVAAGRHRLVIVPSE